MKVGTLFALVALIALPFAAQAGSDLSKLSGMQNPGEWEVTATINMKMTGMPADLQKPRTTTLKKCITRDDMNKMNNFTPKNVNGMTCTMVKKDLSGNTFTYTMKCTGSEGNMVMNGSSVFESRVSSHSHVEMKGTMDNMPMTMTMDANSKRIGDCEATPEKH